MSDTVFPTPKMKVRLARLWEALLAEPVPPHPEATQWRVVAVLQKAESKKLVLLNQDAPANRTRRTGLARWLQDLVQLEDAGSALPSEDEANSEPSPFRWEPKRAAMNVTGRSNPPFSKAADLRHFAPHRPRIPIRPLHKQPFYRRFLFYLRRWLNSSVWQESDPAA